MTNLLYTILCVICLCIGFFMGLTKKSEEKKTNKIDIHNPIEKIKTKIENDKVEKEIQEQLDEINTIYSNIENYDGTSKNQKELKNIEIGIL